MTTTSFLTQKAQTLLEPDEDIMFDRVGRDRRGIRREIAPLTTMSRGDRYIEEGDGYYVDADSDMPTGTTGVGEVMGNVDIVRYTGDRVHLPRMTHGLTVDIEEMQVDGAEEKLRRSRDAIMEMFDIQADLQFLTGITDEEGNSVQPSLFSWLDNNMDANNIIDAGTWQTNNSSSLPANVIVSEAYSKTTGEYADDGWDMVLWKHNVRALWNRIDNNSGVAQKSQWLDLQSDNAGVGDSLVNDAILIPDNIGLRTAPDANDTLRFPINFPTASAGSDDDVMYLVPSHGGDFFEMYEQPEPTLLGDPIQKEGGKQRWEYYWRAGQAFGFGSHKNDDGTGAGEATDVVKIENVSGLDL